jgi:uncharacterized repeat protein (TIGR03847 family)
VTVGAVGPPGKRVFYLQIREEDRLVSLKLEKEQVRFLAGGLSEVLADLASPTSVPTEADLDLEQPVEAEWVVGSMQLAYDERTDRVVLVAKEVGPPDEEDPLEQGGRTDRPDEARTDRPDEAQTDRPDEAQKWPSGATWDEAVPSSPAEGEAGIGVARVALTREQAAGVIENGKRLLRSGRPPCPLCGYPLSEEHSCPKTNGHRSPAL